MLPVRALASDVLSNSSSVDYNDRWTHNVETLIQEFVREVLSNGVSQLNSPVKHLPADRAGVMHAQRAVISFPRLKERHICDISAMRSSQHFQGFLPTSLNSWTNFGVPMSTSEDLAANLERTDPRHWQSIAKTQRPALQYFRTGAVRVERRRSTLDEYACQWFTKTCTI